MAPVTKLPVYVINRDKDRERWWSVRASLVKYPFLEINRIAAIDGHAPGFDAQTALPGLFDNLDPVAR